MPVVDAEAQLVVWVAAELPSPCQPGHGRQAGQARAHAGSRSVGAGEDGAWRGRR
jgi:hypothetical protein